MTLAAQVERLSIADHADQEQRFDIILVDIRKSSKTSGEVECVKKNLYEPGLNYVAISYRWGELREQLAYVGDPSDKDSYIAHVSSFDLGDFKKLCTCIQFEEDLKNLDYLWIDAICIDQVDEEKRKATIRHMSEIYEHASYVLAVPDLHLAYLKLNPANERVIHLASWHALYIYHLLSNDKDTIRNIELTWWNIFFCHKELHPKNYLIFYGRRLQTKFASLIHRLICGCDNFDANKCVCQIADLLLPWTTTPSQTGFISRIKSTLTVTRSLTVIDQEEEKVISHHSLSRIERSLKKYFTCLSGGDKRATFHSFPCDDFYAKNDFCYGCTVHNLKNLRCDDCKSDPAMCDAPCYDLDELWSTHPWKDKWQEKVKEWCNETAVMVEEVGEALKFLAHLMDDWSNRTWVISEYLIAKNKANPASMKLLFLSLVPDADFVQYSPRKFIHIFETKHGEGHSIYGHLRDISSGVLTKAFVLKMQRTHLNCMLLSKASRNEDRFYSILPLWGKYKRLIPDKNTISGWKIKSMMSVTLKLYEFMDKEDKIDLLYSSRLPANRSYHFNYEDSCFPITLPSFATAFYDCSSQEDHFVDCATHQARNVQSLKWDIIFINSIISSNITAIDLEARKDASDNFGGLANVEYRLCLRVKQYMKLKVILDSDTYAKACCQLGLDSESLDAICVTLYALGGSLDDLDGDDIWRSLNSDSYDMWQGMNRPVELEWYSLNSNVSLEYQLYMSPLCLIGDAKRNRWIVYCYLYEYIGAEEKSEHEIEELFLELHKDESCLYIY